MINNKKYLDFLRCSKKYWLESHIPEDYVLPEIAKKELIWENNLKRKVQERFSDSVIIMSEDVQKEIADTEEALAQDVSNIFNAKVQYDDIIVNIDFLNKKANEWQVVIVKNTLSTPLYKLMKQASVDDNPTITKEVKPMLQELALLKYIIEKTEIIKGDIKYCVMCLNYNYKKQEELDLIQLTKIFNMDKFVDKFLINVESDLNDLRKVKSEPEVLVGSHCKSPGQCKFKDHCWKNISEKSIHYLPRITPAKRELFEKNGWLTIDDIPNIDENLAETQRKIARLIKADKVKKNPMKLQMFLNRLRYPLFHLDFETHFPNIPLHEGMRPLDPVPFQYSLHIEQRNGDLEHKGFLHDKETDPRLDFIKNLIVQTEGTSSVIVYNKTFESTILKMLAEQFPEYEQELLAIDKRLVDIMMPFKEFDYWHPRMLFSNSLKYVLPALVPSMSYDNLLVKNGEDAMLMYEDLVKMEEGPEKEKLRNAYIEYCGQDTLAMVEILKVLRKK